MNNSSLLSTTSSPRRQPKQKRGQERVEKIILAATAVFTEVGYAAATTQQIADRANTAVGSIYQFFPDKLAIFRAIEAAYREKIDEMAIWIENVEITRPLVEIISEFIDLYSTYLEEPIARCIVFQSLRPPIPGVFDLLDEDKQNLMQASIARHADFYQKRHPRLSRSKSELLSTIAHNACNPLLAIAFNSNAEDRPAIYQELKDLLYGYLDPHIGDRFLASHNIMMICPHCQSDRVAKNGRHNSRQRFVCRSCGRQFFDRYTPRGYPPETKHQCLELHRQGISFREIERQTGVSHNTVINWVRELSANTTGK
jgi:AcrR family transcriptional regulator